MRASLSREGVNLEERDFFQEPFSKEELIEAMGGRPVRDIFSWSSPSFRKLGLKRDELSDDRLVEMMLEEPRLIRRPLVLVGDDLIVGSGKAALSRIEDVLA